MATTDFPSVSDLNDIESIKLYLYKFDRALKYLLEGKLSTKNIREIGGWQVDEDVISSLDGDVGLSTRDTAGDDIRIWAGSTNRDSAAFRVSESGKMWATDGYFIGDITASSVTSSDIWGGTITGSLIRTSQSSPRLEMDTVAFYGYDYSNVKRVEIGTNFRGFGPGVGFMDTYGALAGVVQAFGNFTFEVAGPGSSTFIDFFSSSMKIVSPTIELFAGSGFNVQLTDGFSHYKVLSQRNQFYTDYSGEHNHGIPPGTQLATVGGGAVTWVSSGGHSHNVGFSL